MSIDFAPDALRGRRILCACSGGADSMCLLHLMHTAGLDVAAAHFEHGIRGEEALRDARFVKDWCDGHGIPCAEGHADVPAYAREHSLSTEEAARELRYAFLNRTADELGCELIATAHNLSDNAETVLFNLCRGTGSAGLRGIARERGRYIRPLLGTARAEIEDYLRENGVPYVEDSTNESDDYSRNRIRHHVMPELRRINAQADFALSRAAELTRRDDECLAQMAEDFIREHYDGESLPLDALNALHWAVASRVIRSIAKKSLTMEQVEKALALARLRGARRLDLPGQSLRFEQGRLWTASESAETITPRVLIPGERLELPEAGLAIMAKNGFFEEEVNDLFKTYFLKCENIKGNVTVTGRRPGDRLHPAGRGCGKSLKSLFLEAGYTQRQRDLTPVFRDGEGILAVYGFGQDERTKPQRGDKALEIKIEQI